MNYTDNFWESIYKKHIKNMIGICYRYVGNRQIAEDLAHDAFTKAIDNSDNFQGRGSFDAWLRRIVVNNALSYLRNKKREKLFNDDYIHSESFRDNTTENLLEQNSFSLEELLDAINSLPEQHKLVFNLYVLDKFTHIQIAEELGISSGTSKSHLARARKKLRKLLYEKALLNKHNNKKKNRALLLLVLSFNWRYVDTIFKNVFKKFEIKHQNSEFIKSISTSKTFNLKPKPKIFYLKIILFIGVGVALIMTSFLYKNELFIKKSNVKKEFVSQNFISKTATFSNDNVILNNNLKTDTVMKKIKQLGFVTLLTASCFTNDTIGQTGVEKKKEDNIISEKSIVSQNSNKINKDAFNSDAYKSKKNAVFYNKIEYPLDFCNLANESYNNVSKWEMDLTCCNNKEYYKSKDDVKKNSINTLVWLSLKSVNNKQFSVGTYIYENGNVATRQQMTFYGSLEIDAEKLNISGGEINIEYLEGDILVTFNLEVNNGKALSGKYLGSYKTFLAVQKK